MLLWPLLLGCPYIFGPADVSNVVVPSVPTGDTAVVPTPTGTTGTTGDTGPIGIPPEITNLELDPTWEGFVFRVGLTDGDGDLSGGSIVVDDGAGSVDELFIPYDVRIVAGEASFVLGAGDPCDDWNHTFTVTVRDGSGNTSPSAQLTTVASGDGHVNEVLDDVFPFGSVASDHTACASIDSNNDNDRFSFTVPSDTRLRISLTWNSDADVDYDVFRNGVGWAGSYGVVQPEALERQFAAGYEYVINVYKVPNPAYVSPSVYQLLLLPDAG